MLSRIAKELQTNQKKDVRQTALASSHQFRLKVAGVDHMMPYDNHLHPCESLEIVKGNRSVPLKCAVTMAKVKKIMGLDENNPEDVDFNLPHLCPTVLRWRISVKRLLEGYGPLPIPRPKTEFSLAWLLYCAVYYDEDNLTIYSSGEVNLDNRFDDTVLGILWDLKAQAQAALVEMGYDDTPKMRKFALQIWQAYLDKIRYEHYHKHNPIQHWASLLAKATDEIKTKITALCSLAYANYTLQQIKPVDKVNYKRHFEKAAWVAFALDPLSGDLSKANFEELGLSEKFPIYQKYQGLLTSFDNLIRHSTYSQTPMAKLTDDVLEKYKAPVFEVFFKSIPMNLPENTEDAERRKQKNAGVDMTMLSLGKRLKKMRIDSETEDEPLDYEEPIKKKAVVKKRKTTSSTKCVAGDSDLDSYAETEVSPKKRQVMALEIADFCRKDSEYLLDKLDASSISTRTRERMMEED